MKKLLLSLVFFSGPLFSQCKVQFDPILGKLTCPQTVNATGSGVPGGSAGQVQYQINGTTFGGFTPAGDVTAFSQPNFTIGKIGGVAIPTSGVLKGAAGPSLVQAVSGTDYAPATSGSSILKGSSGGFAATLAADVVGLFSGCSGVLLLGADGACHSGAASSPAYTAAVSGQTTLSVSAATHLQGTTPIGACFDNSSPALAVSCQYTRDGSGNVVFTWSPAFTGSVQIISGSGSGGGSGSGTVTSVSTTGPITGGTFTTSGTIGCATCVANTGTPVNHQIAIWASATTEKGLSTATIDDSGNATLTSVSTGLTYSGTPGTSGLWACGEGTAPTGQASVDVLYCDSTAHRMKGLDNNGSAFQYVHSGVDINTSDQVTVTHLASALPVAQGGTGITSFGAGIATWLGTPSSANLATALTDETGSGAAVFANTPTLVTPVIGVATGTSLLATGIVDGKAPVDITTGTTASLGGTFQSGYTFNQEATAATAVAYTLPTAAAGRQYCVANSYNGTAPNTGVLTVNTSASGQFIIFTDGSLSATGGNVTSGGAARDSACFVGSDSTHWILYPSSGTWTKH